MDCQSAAEELGYSYKGKYRVVTSGAPDLSVSEAECKQYAEDINLDFAVNKEGDWSWMPHGCTLYDNRLGPYIRVYWMEGATTNHNCHASLHDCVQKLPMDVANGCVLYENNVYWNKGPFSDIVVQIILTSALVWTMLCWQTRSCTDLLYIKVTEHRICQYQKRNVNFCG